MANDPLVGFSDAMRIEVRTRLVGVPPAGLEVLRQIHFLISEHSARLPPVLDQMVFGGFERATHRRISDWSRFRIGRVLTWVLWIVDRRRS